MIFINSVAWYLYTFSFKKHKFLFFLTLFIGLCAAVFGSLGVGLLVPTISTLINDNSSSYFNEILTEILNFISFNFNVFNSLLIASIIIFLGDLLSYTSTIVSSHLTKIALIESRTSLFRKILYEDFVNIIENKSGKISSIVNEQVSLASEVVEAFFRLSLNGLFAIFLIIALCLISVKLTLLSIFIGFFVLVSQHKIYSLFIRYWSTWQENKISLTTYYNDLINSIKFIKQTGKEEDKELELSKMSNKEGLVIFRAFVFKYLSPFYTKGLATWLVFVIVIVGLEFFKSTGPEILIFLFIIRKLQASINQINLSFLEISKGYTNVSLIKNYFLNIKNFQIKYGANKFQFKYNIEFKNLSFKYKNNDVLSGLSFKISSKNFISIIGSSGSGKSTIFNLFSRILKQDEGAILIDGINIENFEKKDYFKNIAFISQEPYVFNDTIKNNICDDLPYNKKKFKKVLDITNAKNFINLLNNDENIKIGERGLKVSGGQLQRLVLCRALYKEPSILFLDEATSALDPMSEEHILNKIKINYPKLTVINIAHRISSLKNSDKILILNKGKIVYEGDFASISEESELFRDFFKTND